MSTPRIDVRGVSKKFRLGELHDSLRDLIPALTRRFLGREQSANEAGTDEFWALRDISFSVEPGQALGIIGPNGAGKSTMLKLLTRILRPTRGAIRVVGRVGSLIEIAGGFHPDLTGRENIYLQGAIMGMRRHEIDERFDQIVEFSGIEDFIETQVKRYSTGMNARLGFSIAAHLQPEVLIIDEVLAVGDHAFQQRAFGRIGELARGGMPVVVVSHQLDKIASLCTDVILLDKGRIRKTGTPAECISEYIEAESSTSVDEQRGPIRLEHLRLPGGPSVASGDRFTFELQAVTGSDSEFDRYAIGFRFRALHTGEVLYTAGTDRLELELPEREELRLRGSLRASVPAGLYALQTLVWDTRRGEQVVDGPTVTVEVTETTTFHGKVQLGLALELLGKGGTIAGSLGRGAAMGDGM